MRTAFVFSLLPLGLSGYAQPQDALRPLPNIVWLTYEDTSPQFIGCYGNAEAKTPVMDSLASRGVRFMNAFSTGTVSSPSRFCLITGCKPGRYGTGNHRSMYRVPDFLTGFPKYLRDKGYYTTNNSKTDYNNARAGEMIRESWCESSGRAHWRSRKPGQPFFAVFNSIHSHQSRTMTNPWPVYERQVLACLPDSLRTDEQADFEMPPFYVASEKMRRCVSRVYNSISRTDQQFGEILHQLEEDHLLDSTIVFCFSDHGEGIPRGKGSALGMGYRVPFILYVPEMYRDLFPSWEEGSTTDMLVGFEDMAATVLSLAGVPLPEHMEGFTITGQREQRKRRYVFGACDGIDGNVEFSRSVTDGDYMYTRVFTPYQPFVRWINYFDVSEIQRLMRADYVRGEMNELQAAIMEPRSVEYLYDLKNDKWETVNLAENPRYASLLKHYRRVLRNHLLQTPDANLIPEYTLSQEGFMAYDFVKRRSSFPNRRIVETAYLSGEGDCAIPRLLKRVTDENDFVQYWAAIGLFSAGNGLAQVDFAPEDLMKRITYPPAKVWYAAAVLNNGWNETIGREYEELLLNGNEQLAILAICALLEMNHSSAERLIQAIHRAERLYKNDASVNNMIQLARLKLEGVIYDYKNYW